MTPRSSEPRTSALGALDCRRSALRSSEWTFSGSCRGSAGWGAGHLAQRERDQLGGDAISSLRGYPRTGYGVQPVARVSSFSCWATRIRRLARAAATRGRSVMRATTERTFDIRPRAARPAPTRRARRRAPSGATLPSLPRGAQPFRVARARVRASVGIGRPRVAPAPARACACRPSPKFGGGCRARARASVREG